MTLSLHAGSVLYKGLAYLFIAPTRTGKTTLTAYLAESGAAYLSDDGAEIDGETLLLRAAPTPLHLREESVDVLRAYGIDIRHPVTEVEGARRIVYLPRCTFSGEVPLARLFFLCHTKGDNRCEPLAGEEAVRLLMQNLLTPEADLSASLRCAIQLAPRCRRLFYADMAYVRALLDEEV